jgi:3-mercaptopyruvate sulfurtransferase SseA
MRSAILFSVSLFAIYAENNTMLISTAALADRLEEESLVIFHVGSQKDYDAGHIPGARLITLADISITGEGGLRLELPPTETLLSAKIPAL